MQSYDPTASCPITWFAASKWCSYTCQRDDNKQGYTCGTSGQTLEFIMDVGQCDEKTIAIKESAIYLCRGFKHYWKLSRCQRRERTETPYTMRVPRKCSERCFQSRVLPVLLKRHNAVQLLITDFANKWIQIRKSQNAKVTAMLWSSPTQFVHLFDGPWHARRERLSHTRHIFSLEPCALWFTALENPTEHQVGRLGRNQ